MYCSSVKHKSKYVNQQSKRNDHKASEINVGEGGIGKQSNVKRVIMRRGRGLRERTGECCEADVVLRD